MDAGSFVISTDLALIMRIPAPPGKSISEFLRNIPTWSFWETSWYSVRTFPTIVEYLSGWMGGPPLYVRRTGTVCLTKPHQPYAIGAAERDQWLLCMERALEEVGAGADVKEMLREPLFRIADMMVNR